MLDPGDQLGLSGSGHQWKLVRGSMSAALGEGGVELGGGAPGQGKREAGSSRRIFALSAMAGLCAAAQCERHAAPITG
jgi:hypothetical protein